MFLYLGCAIIILWGIVHLRPAGGATLRPRDRLLQGVIPLGLGVLVFAAEIVGGFGRLTCSMVAKMAAGLLVVLAVVDMLRPANPSGQKHATPMRIYPAVMTLTAVLFLFGAADG
jgi:hypothetical protein